MQSTEKYSGTGMVRILLFGHDVRYDQSRIAVRRTRRSVLGYPLPVGVP